MWRWGRRAEEPLTLSTAFANSSSSCGSCAFILPTFTEFFWVPKPSAATTKTSPIYTATEIVYYSGTISVTTVITVPVSNYSQYLPTTTTVVETLVRTYGDDDFTTVM